ncbi:MAG: nitronate monooxygenase [Dehalococcoidia bacterium]|nr:nitronate monooxygenase [Dehalococcoidia bacterium]
MRNMTASRTLSIEYPILQAGVPWVSNPELVASVSDSGGLGILHPSAGMDLDGDMVGNLRENIRNIRRLTGNPFGVSFYLANPQVEQLIEVGIEEGMKVAVTYSGSPALYTGKLKENDVKVLHQVSTVRHARGAESQGVDAIIAEGYEGGGIRGPEEIPNLPLLPQVADAVSIPIIASGGIMDARGYAAALALGAHGVQLGTRFVATHECIAHPKYKEAIVGAIDTGTVIAGRYHRPTRVLRSDAALRLKDSNPPAGADMSGHWEAELGPAQVRAALLEGDPAGIAYCGAGVGLVSEILSVDEVMRGLVEGVSGIIASLR